jgi:hypothetical protein
MPRAAGAPDPGWVIAALGLFAIRKRAGAAAFWPGGVECADQPASGHAGLETLEYRIKRGGVHKQSSVFFL